LNSGAAAAAAATRPLPLRDDDEVLAGATLGAAAAVEVLDRSE
jgi:hypothetical protein